MGIVLAVESLGCTFRAPAPTSKLGTAGWSVTLELGRNEADRPQGSLGSRQARSARFRFSERPCCSQIVFGLPAHKYDTETHY